MARKHKHGKNKNRQSQQAEQAQHDLVQHNLSVLFDWYLAQSEHYTRKMRVYAKSGNERLLEAAAGKVQLFRYKAERLMNIL